MARKLNHQTRKSIAPITRFGKKISFSQRHTARVFKPNLQWTTVMVEGKRIRIRLSAGQIRTLSKSDPDRALVQKIRALGK